MNITNENHPLNKGEIREMTEGEKIVGITFNPSEDVRVKQIKEKCDSLIDEIKDIKNNRKTSSGKFQDQVFDNAIMKVLEAQMLAVKAIFI